MKSNGASGYNQMAEQSHQKLDYFYLPFLPSLGQLHPTPSSPSGCKMAASSFWGPHASLLYSKKIEHPFQYVMEGHSCQQEKWTGKARKDCALWSPRHHCSPRSPNFSSVLWTYIGSYSLNQTLRPGGWNMKINLSQSGNTSELALGSLHSEMHGLHGQEKKVSKRKSKHWHRKEGKVDSGQPQRANVFDSHSTPSLAIQALGNLKIWWVDFLCV